MEGLQDCVYCCQKLPEVALTAVKTFQNSNVLVLLLCTCILAGFNVLLMALPVLL